MKQTLIIAILMVGIIGTANAEYWRDSSGTIVQSKYDECITNVVGTYDDADESLLNCNDATLVPKLKALNVKTNFDFDSVELDDTAVHVAKKFNTEVPADAKVVVIGHTDAVGTEAYNTDLGFRRATAVRSRLTGNNVNATSKGESELLIITDDKSRTNRRVELKARWVIHVIERNDR